MVWIFSFSNYPTLKYRFLRIIWEEFNIKKSRTITELVILSKNSVFMDMNRPYISLKIVPLCAYYIKLQTLSLMDKNMKRLFDILNLKPEELGPDGASYMGLIIRVHFNIIIVSSTSSFVLCSVLFTTNTLKVVALQYYVAPRGSSKQRYNLSADVLPDSNNINCATGSPPVSGR